MTKQVYSVSSVNQYIKQVIGNDILLSSLFVKGEASNVKYHSSGHLYFTLKDDGGSIPCVMFQSARNTGLTFRMQDGDTVICAGAVDVYPRDGRYQLYVKEIKKEGIGDLYERFLALKNKLEESGMFSEMYKRPIPEFSHTIGIVTSGTGAAIHDIETVCRRRNPYVSLVLYPAVVQGEEAPESIVRGIEALDHYGVDVIICGRGGGSMEDLWCFNDERVARAIFACQTPVISAVGHETDVTIADLVADLRAPTPSAAAELACFDVIGLLRQLDHLKSGMDRSWNAHIQRMIERSRHLQTRIEYGSPHMRIERHKDTAMRLRDRFSDTIRNLIEQRRTQEMRLHEEVEHHFTMQLHRIRERESHAAIRLDASSPLGRMSGGYAFITKEDGGRIRSVQDVKSGSAIRAYLSDGYIVSEVKESIKTPIGGIHHGDRDE